MQVSTLETDSDPAADDLLIHVLNVLTCPLDQKLRAFKMHTKVGARSSILRNAYSYYYCLSSFMHIHTYLLIITPSSINKSALLV